MISLKDFKITAGRKRVVFNLEANTIRIFHPHDWEIKDIVRNKIDKIDEYRKK